jgi:putative endonuclease
MFFTYLLASKPHGTLYVGSTSNLVRYGGTRLRRSPGSLQNIKYSVDRLVWFERHDALETAMRREKRIKGWKRAWIIELIEKDNPHWIDLYPYLSR